MSPYVPIHGTFDSDDNEPISAPSTRSHPMFDEDHPCANCGYNLRGLPYGSKCPECGADPNVMGSGYGELNINAPRLTKLVDIILISGGAERRRWQLGLTIATFCLVGVIAARFGYFFLGMTAAGALDNLYLATGMAISIAWAVAIAMIVPRSIQKCWPKLKPLRMVVITTQMLWVPAYAVWLLDGAGLPINTKVLGATYFILRAIAGIGFIALGQLMVYICEEAELEWAARKFNTASWLIAIPTLMGQLFVGALPWIFIAVFFLVIAWWSVMVGFYALGFWQMRQHASWSSKHARDSVGREHRVAEKKKHLERMNEATIRQYPADRKGDTPLAP